MIWPFGHQRSTPVQPAFLRVILAALLSSSTMPGCVPATEMTTPRGIMQGPLVLLLTPKDGIPQEMWVEGSGEEFAHAFAGLGRSFTVSALGYLCTLRALGISYGRYALWGADHGGRPLPGTDQLFEGEVVDGEFQGWQALTKPSQPMLEARFDPGDTQQPYPDCGMGTIQDVAAR